MEYFVFEYGRQEGPFTQTQLMERGLRPETLVLSVERNEWIPAWQVDELKALLDGARTVHEMSDCDDGKKSKNDERRCVKDSKSDIVSSDSATSSAALAHGERVLEPDDVKRSSCGKNVRLDAISARKRRLGYILAAFLAAVAMLLSVTNPTRQQHVDAVKGQLMKAISSSLDVDEAVLGMFNMGSFGVSGIVNSMADQVLSVDSYGLFSVGHVHFGKYDKVVSFGILGRVFTFDSKDVEKKMNIGGGSDTGEDNADRDDNGDDADNAFPTESV